MSKNPILTPEENEERERARLSLVAEGKEVYCRDILISWIYNWLIEERVKSRRLGEAVRWRQYPAERPPENGVYLVNGEFRADWLDGDWWQPYPQQMQIYCWLPIPK